MALLLMTGIVGAAHKERRVTIMGLGDSITEGGVSAGTSFHSYLFPLWEMLMQEGYTQCEFVGPRTSPCPMGTIRHCGFSGKNVEFLNARIDSIYRACPADIVLLHAGHNHFDTERPVAHMMQCYRDIEQKIHRVNPHAVIVIAKVITSGKLPKYAYLPELNDSIALWVRRKHDKRLLLCDMTVGWDWHQMTIPDRVHPNPAGAALMATRWFEVLRTLLPKATDEGCYRKVVYKNNIKGRPLSLTIYRPSLSSDAKTIMRRPCILYFFAGGWQTGSPLQFVRECSHYSKKGMVAISADYSIANVDGTLPRDAYRDATDAYRWVVAHADSLGIDSQRIYLAGCSAGATMAALMALDRRAEARPCGLLLYYPVLQKIKNSAAVFGVDDKASCLPAPALLVYGDKDPMTPMDEVSRFVSQQQACGAAVSLKIFKGCGHPIFHYRSLEQKIFDRYIRVTDRFLRL